MRFHGLVLLTMVSLSEAVSAQNGQVVPPENFLPPSPRKVEAGNGAPLPLPLPPAPSTTVPDSAIDIEAEMKQFRSELREFQAMREELARTTKATENDADSGSLRQRQELMELLTKIARKSVARKSAAPVDASAPRLETTPPPALPSLPVESTGPIVDADITDAFALGKSLFRIGDFVNAEKAFRKASVTSENELTLKYLLATCLRRQSKWQLAIETYQIVAESNNDPVLRDLAKWQLDNIRWHQQSEAQLEQMRQQRQKRTDPANGQSANVNKARQ